MNRLFVHVLGIEERLNDLEDEIRKLRKEQETARRSASNRRGGSRSSAATERGYRKRIGRLGAAAGVGTRLSPAGGGFVALRWQ